MKKSFIVHPILFGIFPALFLFSHNIEQVSMDNAAYTAIAIAVSVAFALLLWWVLSFVLKDRQKAGLVVTLLLVLFYSYGHFASLIESVNIVVGDIHITRHKILVPVWGLILLLGTYFCIRTSGNLRVLTSVLNVVSASLIVLCLINIGTHTVLTSIALKDYENTSHDEADTTSTQVLAELPDIYYIILDGYASSTTLEEMYNYDNHEFFSYLTDRGFFVASRSNSNYPMTFLSLASSLNMEYVNYLGDRMGIESRTRTVAYDMIRNNKVMKFLKSRGYKFIHLGSGWGATDRNKYADVEIQCGRGNEFVMVLIQTTLLDPFVKNLLNQRERVLCTFSKLGEVYAIEGPKFVFSHINSPRPPFVFGANGEPVPEVKLEMQGDISVEKELYVNQLIFISKQVESLVDEILSKSDSPPVIVLQADHGPGLSLQQNEDSEWERPTEEMLRERFGIFNAYYLPHGGEKLLYYSVTPVNTFRLVFNLYFNMDYELLQDESYYSTYEYPYRFINITDKIRRD